MPAMPSRFAEPRWDQFAEPPWDQFAAYPPHGKAQPARRALKAPNSSARLRLWFGARSLPNFDAVNLAGPRVLLVGLAVLLPGLAINAGGA